MEFDGPTRLVTALIIVCAAGVAVSVLGASKIAAPLVVIAGVLIIYITRGGWDDQPVFAAPPPISSEPIEAILAAMADPVMLLRGARVIHANAAAKALLGAHVIDQDIRLTLRQPELAALFADPQGLGAIEVSGIGAIGQIWEIRVERATVRRRLVQMVDRTARHAAERARVDFVANASHELRTPLATIIGTIETLGEDMAGNNPQTRKRFLGLMNAEARRMEMLVVDLMSLSRIEAEKHHMPAMQVDLAALLAKVAGERRNPIIMETMEALEPIFGDVGQLSQLLHNLIDNGEKYGSPGGKVSVTLTQPTADQIQLSVIDQGEGIAPEHLPRLTERFYRIDAGRSRLAGGTGLGLAIVKHIVQHHRAILLIESVVGEGTKVSVTFPLSQNRHITQT